MTTHFINAEIDLQETPLKVREIVENELAKHGEVLRWAITDVNNPANKIKVEAIVLKEEV